MSLNVDIESIKSDLVDEVPTLEKITKIDVSFTKPADDYAELIKTVRKDLVDLRVNATPQQSHLIVPHEIIEMLNLSEYDLKKSTMLSTMLEHVEELYQVTFEEEK